MRRPVRGHVVVWAMVMLGAAGPAAAQTRGLTPADFYKEVTVEEVATRPQGDMVAFTVMTIVEKENTRHREIWLQPLAAGAPAGAAYRFTSPTENSSQPRWSPDGALLAFTSKRDKDENTTWFARVGGSGGEAFHVDGVSGEPVWSPDGQWIAYVKAPMRDKDGDGAADKKDEREGWVAPDAVSRTLDAKRFDGRVVTSMRYKSNGTLTWMPHYATRDVPQIFVVPAAGGTPVQVTRLAFAPSQLEWLPDNATILFTGDDQQDNELNRELTADLFAVARTGGDPRRLTRNPGAERAPSVSPRGDRLAYQFQSKVGDETDLLVVDLAPDGSVRGQPRNLTAAWDRVPGVPRWTADGQRIRFDAEMNGNAHVFEVAADGQGRVAAVTRGDVSIKGASESRDGAVMAYRQDSPLSPAELFVAGGDGSRAQQVTRFNASWLSEVTLSAPERLTWKVADGTEVEGWLVKPVAYEPGRSYPLVLKIHGGPHTQYGNTWFSTFHILSASGFFVLYPNPRGSSGYGHAFTYATRGKWGELDTEDYLKGIDTAMARYKDIDPKRLGVSGGSYGGFMTNWLSANTTRFAAAVTSRSITNWESWYGTSDAQRLTEHEFFGPPWEQRELYRRLSPISYVEKVRIPTLIINGDQDWRTPPGDGEQWFMALKKRNVPVELVAYPRSTHDLSRTGEPWLLVDRLERIRSWFDHWLNKAPLR
ncbi:S9 family peptidase [Luteitalea sp.]|jgi:dipeptidyl aminopeptidase/acylaminoacyl peptidase|uniref:S9 family peptidase n=1 Tax=Luteitalea sp. TaxID=2004800 RepID=UPI0037CBA665